LKGGRVQTVTKRIEKRTPENSRTLWRREKEGRKQEGTKKIENKIQ
jgi:hypothetical protein